ncbi:thiamine pyrophosphate-binding protein [Candidatus Avelusimicrobium faecicola]|uniref:thiamine pyrophosphate-binding protein n=1 Tax=Candidatus Avelusimicrobium faecicola TaxID=3416205 RepID=UPI003D13FABC
MIKVSDFIAKYLKEQYGVNCVFMVSGGGAMHLNDSFGRFIPYVCCHHEQACAIAAEGYARVNQRLGVVNVTTGPGGLNCLNGVFGQWTDSVPVLYVSGQVKRATTLAACPQIPLRQLGDQEVDIVRVVRPLTKYAVSLTQPEQVRYELEKAVYLATHGRMGPVWLDVPLDVQAAQVDETALPGFTAPLETPADLTAPIRELKKLFMAARRPLIVAGHGIRLAGGIQEFLTLLGRWRVPVVTTMNGFDTVAQDNPQFIARIGTVANRAGNFALQNADLVLTIGSRNNIRQVSYNWENFAKNAKLVCVDIDGAELDKPTLKPALKIQADARDFLRALLAEPWTVQTEKWLAWCKNLQQKYPPVTEAPRAGGPLEAYAFTDLLIRQFSNREVVVCGNGTAFLVPFQVGRVKQGQRYIWNSGDASMGYDLPAAIGACLANGHQRTVCLAGDGSIMMNLQELQTVVHYHLPLKIFILNNGGYVSIQQTQKNFFNGRMSGCTPQSGVSLPDFIQVARAFGLPAERISTGENLPEKLRRLLAAPGPAVCEVMLTPGYIFAPKLSARKLPDGSMVSPSLEDLYPFLDRRELAENMRISGGVKNNE